VTYRYAWHAAIVLAVVATVVGCGNSPVAVVDGVKITEKEFTDRLVSMAGHDVLRDMIDRELIRQAAADAGVEITAEQLDQEIEQAKEQFDSEEQFNQWLASRNLTQEQWRDHVRMALTTRELALKDVQYTDESLKQFFEENKEGFARPALVSLSEIVVNSEEDAREVLAELEKGETSFGDLARRYSLSPTTKDRGGERPEMPIEQIPIEPIREAARSLPIGQASEPIAAEGQWFIIMVRDRKPAREGSWEEDYELIKEQYELANARPLQDILQGQISTSNITIVDPRFQDLNEIYTALPSEMPQFGAEGPASVGGGPAPANAPAPEVPAEGGGE